ncbi:hypothetical protein [Devosia ginsengisoli]|uniref:Transmembrane protein n=1 Tax=Devosia ginsengisoli TaxID=400770 RepID=A0A5B8LY20_9HYPH|nr:hypothetical protein [Devosia ginsengisoli]QDZ12425.1 hypothetical protein FPZ08_17700 [Devosia ginsengisoli]
MTDFATPRPRNASAWIRQIHRWLSMLFTLSVIATFIALAVPEPVVWVSYIPLAPLFLLMGTGLYMFALPYIAKWRGTR